MTKCGLVERRVAPGVFRKEIPATLKGKVDPSRGPKAPKGRTGAVADNKPAQKPAESAP